MRREEDGQTARMMDNNNKKNLMRHAHKHTRHTRDTCTYDTVSALGKVLLFFKFMLHHKFRYTQKYGTPHISCSPEMLKNISEQTVQHASIKSRTSSNTFICTKKKKNAQTLTHTHTANRLTGLVTYYKCHSRNTSGGNSLSSVLTCMPCDLNT